MKDLVSHIEFLILQHNYVIIPDFGGFVLNRESAYTDEEGAFVPPALLLGFNIDLKFNDGLLAESYMQTQSISYDVACTKISETVKALKIALSTGQSIDFGKLGILQFIDEAVVFEAKSKKLDHPNTWGFSKVNIVRLEDIIVPEISSEKLSFIKEKLKPILFGAASAAAVIAFFALPVSHNATFFEKTQQSGFFTQYITSTGKALNDKAIVKDDKVFIVEQFIESKNRVEEETAPIAKIEPPKVRTKKYYIIVGSDTHKTIANNLLTKVKANGFNGASLLESSDRIRIYVAAFTNKNEANTYLDSFRIKHPAYNDAWLLAK